MLRFNVFIVFLFVILLDSTSQAIPIKAISIFRNDEIVYHKYSAVLAAAEPFRLQLEDEIKTAMNPLAYLFRKFQGFTKKSIDELRLENTEIDSAYSRYEKRVDEIVKSYGLDTDTFNTLSERISQDTNLKQKVLLQGYYYRLAADLESNIRQTMPILPSMSVSSRILKFSPSSRRDDDKLLSSYQSEPLITRFCRSLRAIEYERLQQRERLQQNLGIKSLPERMCDPDIYPAMSKEIQMACVEFQNIASDIIENYDLDLEEFNGLQENLKKNALFKLRVERELKKLEKESQKSKDFSSSSLSTTSSSKTE